VEEANQGSRPSFQTPDALRGRGENADQNQNKSLRKMARAGGIEREKGDRSGKQQQPFRGLARHTLGEPIGSRCRNVAGDEIQHHNEEKEGTLGAPKRANTKGPLWAFEKKNDAGQSVERNSKLDGKKNTIGRTKEEIRKGQCRGTCSTGHGEWEGKQLSGEKGKGDCGDSSIGIRGQ